MSVIGHRRRRHRRHRMTEQVSVCPEYVLRSSIT